MPTVGGPIAGGPPMAVNAAQGASRPTVTLANVNSDLVVLGQAQPNATQVTVFVNGGTPHGVPLTPGTTQQPWQATIPAAELFALPDGPVTVNDAITLPTGTIAGDPLAAVTKDLGGLSVTASPAAGNFTTPQTVTLASTQPGQIFFTTNGTPPTTASTPFTTPIPVTANTTIKFLFVNAAGVQFPVLTSQYAFTLPGAPPPVAVPPVVAPPVLPVVVPPLPPVAPPPPVVAPPPPVVVPPPAALGPTPLPFAVPSRPGLRPQTLRPGQTVGLFVTNVPAASIFFTLDGTDPTIASTRFVNPLALPQGLDTLKFIATAGGTTSAIVTTVYLQK